MSIVEDEETEYHLKGTLTLHPTEIGGRETPCWEGYRPNYMFGENGGSIVITWMDEDKLEPGESSEVEMTFLTPEHAKEGLEKTKRNLTPGDIVVISEGPIEVGRLKVEEVNW